ncbi:MAG: sigma-70 family RNA polymerase sigma factor [Planctomycetota bacterium]
MTHVPAAVHGPQVALELASVRLLARHLTRDADDLTQDVAVMALSQPASQYVGLPWLKGVARRLVLVRLRSKRRREQRERRGAVPAVPASPADDAAHREFLQILTGEAERLREPYRTAVQLRYFAQLEPREIAARLGVPAATARSRVKRGLAQLRARLDHRDGEREHWCRALAARALALAGSSPR